jgi:hypothetical protein
MIFTPLLFITAITLTCLLITRWVVDRWPDDVVVPGSSDGKAYELQDQVNSKILWDAPEWEVLEWLEDKHSVRGELAEQMLRTADFFRRRAIREKALYGAIACLIGLSVCGGLIWAQLAGGFIFIIRSLALAAAFLFCGFWFVRYTGRLVTGRTDSSAGL